MSYTSAEGRQQLLVGVAEATAALGLALAALGAAHEQLDDYHGDQLEAALFRPVQLAFGRAKRTHAAFAARHGLVAAEPALASAGPPSLPAKEFIDRAVAAVSRADDLLAALQDSMLPVEVGDADLRAGLSEVRRLIGGLPRRAHEVVRTLGR